MVGFRQTDIRIGHCSSTMQIDLATVVAKIKGFFNTMLGVKERKNTV
jgi:hypothetical protein